jgi:hypothetical protein
VNVAAAYPFYALPIFFPHLIWLGLAPILFNLMELVIHGGIATSVTKAPYNPGLATSLVWLILTVWYVAELYRQSLVTGGDWGIAIGYLIAWTVLALPVFTFVLLSDRNSRYPFTSEELSRFEKYRRFIHTTIHP